MVLFFDLSIPYLDGGGAAASSSSSRSDSKDRRLKAVVRAMELGYIGVAYDRPVRGILSDADRCKITPFPLSSLLKAAPPLAASASFHRDLLGAPLSAPFRQYTRLTVSAQGAAAVLALNGNPVLKTYDLVAVRPLNQEAFDRACESSEVDIIAIDFSQKLSFRLKLPLVKLAVQRGLHFEITYTHLLADVHLRRQILSDARLLVDCTRGKNLIISSAASSVHDIRGPNDVANLAVSLLGLYLERAKAALSGCCRSLIAKAIRKKHFYKEAIRIEKIIPEEKLDSKRYWVGDWSDWDPISAGEGDIPSLNDITKCSSSVSDPSLRVSSIDFESLHGTPFLFGQNDVTYPSSKKLEASALSHDLPHSMSDGVVEEVGLDDDLLLTKTSTALSPWKQQKLSDEKVLFSPKDACSQVADANILSQVSEVTEDSRYCDQFSIVFGVTEIPSNQKALGIACISDGKLLLDKDNPASSALVVNKELSDICMEDQISSYPSSFPCDTVSTDALKGVAELIAPIQSSAHDQIHLHDKDSLFLMEKKAPQDQTITKVAEQEQKDDIMSCHHMRLQKCLLQSENTDGKEGVPSSGVDNLLKNAFMETKEQEEMENLFEIDAPAKVDVGMVEGQIKPPDGVNVTVSCKAKPGSAQRREKLLYPAYPLPFKNLFKPMIVNKKRRKKNKQGKHLVGNLICCIQKVIIHLQLAVISLGARGLFSCYVGHAHSLVICYRRVMSTAIYTS